MGGSKRRKASVLNKQTRKGKEPTSAEINQLVALFNTGRHAEMETLARLLADRRPDSGIAWKALGVSLQTQGKDSLPALQKAAKLLPEDADAHINLGNALKNLGRLDSAEASYRRAMALSPNVLWPLRLISRWKYDHPSDSFHIGRCYHFQKIVQLR